MCAHKEKFLEGATMNKNPLSAILCASLLCIGVYAIAYTGVIYRFKHPDLTETQLFLANWRLSCCGLLSIVFGTFGLLGK
jgi:formate hydrogenlyase subunit 3/multisubunit Na+/H+ antiporter MnhD subunit